ncbi:MAG: hypothetical protein K2K07_07505 [Lachnospiraceae bacterium]|nr:hypothetical protein [Lachnospiraceae bacterium]
MQYEKTKTDVFTKSIKQRYQSNVMDDIILYFMRTILHFEKSGIEDLPLEQSFPKPINDFLNLAMELIIDGQPPEVSTLILDTEYDMILHKEDITSEIVLGLRMVRELSWHIHYDEDSYEYIFMTENLWGNRVSEYAARTFYPNLPDAIKDKYQIHDLIKYMPQEMFKLEDY